MDVKKIQNINDCEVYLEGLLNDFEAGIALKDEILSKLFDYTIHISVLNLIDDRFIIPDN